MLARPITTDNVARRRRVPERVHERQAGTGRVRSAAVLFEQRFWQPVADGTVTVTFRRWKRRQVVPGRRYRTAAGILEIESVAVVDPVRISTADARRAGYANPAALVADLHGDSPTVYRVQFHAVGGADPRDELAARAHLSEQEAAELDRRLARLDAASRHGPWTAAVLRAIAQHPSRRAADLAAEFGRERLAFKADVRKLKNLGLTQSLDVGYRLSPRGDAYLRRRR